MRREVSGLIWLLVGGCGEDAIEPAQLGELCGSEAPVRVLELPEDVRSVVSLPAGERVMHLVHRRIPPDADTQYATYDQSAVWATGPCGEAPVQVATGMQTIFTQPMWPGVVLGCEEETGNVVVLDPEGGAAKVLFAAVPHVYFGCGLKWTPHGLLSVETIDEEAETGKLWLHPYPEDPRGEVPEPVVLLDSLRARTAYISGPGLIGDVVRSFDDFVLAVTPTDELVRVDVAERAVSVMQEEVYAIEASRSGRYVLWQDLRVTRDDPIYPEGAVALRDQEDGSDVFLAETALALSPSPLGLADEGIVQLGLGFIHGAPRLAFFLPDFNPIEMRQDQYVSARVDERRVITNSIGGEVALADLRAGESTLLSQKASQLKRIEDDAAVLLILPPCCISSEKYDEGTLVRVPFDGSAVSKLADRATWGLRWLEDGRVLTAVNIDGQERGDLVLIDPEAGTERRVDGQVATDSLYSAWGVDEGVLSYSVADGDRSGIYVARLPEYVGTRRRTVKPGAMVEEGRDGVVRWGDGSINSSSRRRR